MRASLEDWCRPALWISKRTLQIRRWHLLAPVSYQKQVYGDVRSPKVLLPFKFKAAQQVNTAEFGPPMGHLIPLILCDAFSVA